MGNIGGKTFDQLIKSKTSPSTICCLIDVWLGRWQSRHPESSEPTVHVGQKGPNEFRATLVDAEGNILRFKDGNTSIIALQSLLDDVAT
jgi:hypothetical protein